MKNVTRRIFLTVPDSINNSYFHTYLRSVLCVQRTCFRAFDYDVYYKFYSTTKYRLALLIVGNVSISEDNIIKLCLNFFGTSCAVSGRIYIVLQQPHDDKFRLGRTNSKSVFLLLSNFSTTTCIKCCFLL